MYILPIGLVVLLFFGQEKDAAKTATGVSFHFTEPASILVLVHSRCKFPFSPPEGSVEKFLPQAQGGST